MQSTNVKIYFVLLNIKLFPILSRYSNVYFARIFRQKNRLGAFYAFQAYVFYHIFYLTESFYSAIQLSKVRK